MKISKRSIYLVIFSVFVLSFSLWYFLRDEAPTDNAHFSERVSEDDHMRQEISEFSIFGRNPRDEGSWQLEGSHAVIFENKVHLQGLSAELIGEEGTVYLFSNEGFFCRLKNEVELIGDVVVRTHDDTTLKTDKAKWSQKEQKIFTDSRVRIERADLSATGLGAEADVKNRIAQLKREVVVMMEPGTRISCSGPLKVLGEEDRAELYNNVIVDDEEGRLIADMLTVYFDRDTQKLAKAVAVGNVKVKRGNSYTLSEKAVYTESTRSAKLKGGARIIIDPEQVEEFDEMESFSTTGEQKGS